MQINLDPLGGQTMTTRKRKKKLEAVEAVEAVAEDSELMKALLSGSARK